MENKPIFRPNPKLKLMDLYVKFFSTTTMPTEPNRLGQVPRTVYRTLAFNTKAASSALD
jgi:hypothetical protein